MRHGVLFIFVGCFIYISSFILKVLLERLFMKGESQTSKGRREGSEGQPLKFSRCSATCLEHLVIPALV